MKQRAFEIQKGVCKSCKEVFEMSDMDGDHITPWAEGGKTIAGNLTSEYPKNEWMA